MTTLRRQVKNMVKNYSEAEVKVREATSNDPWGPSSTLMAEISDLTYNIVALGEVMKMIWKRLNDHGKNWRHVYKSLVLLDYLIKNGNEKVAQQCKEHIVAIQTLKDFQYMEEQKDQGASVREKAKQLVNLLRDDERLKQERIKAFKARERFAQNAMGISSDNKMTYAPGSRAGASSKAGGQYADPYGGASGRLSADHLGAASPSLAPDLEAVRPSDANEEDLQIKLAIMLSQQEHEEEVQRKRADEAKLQIALEQSKTEGQPNGLVDLSDNAFNDPWSSSNDANHNNSSRKHNRSVNDDESSDDFFPPLSSLKQQQQQQPVNAGHIDPWSPAAAAAATTNGTNKSNLFNFPPPTNGTSTLSSQHHHLHHQQQQQQQPSVTNPWSASSNSTATNSNPISADPWSSSPSAPINSNQSKLDDFDLFTSNRVTTTSTSSNSSSSATAAAVTSNSNTNSLINTNNNNTTSPPNSNANSNDPFGDFFGNSSNTQTNKSSTNPWNSTTGATNGTTTTSSNDLSKTLNDPFASLATPVQPTTTTAASSLASSGVPKSTIVLNPTRKTPESFLGENSSLVNLDNLIPARPKSTNPFGSTIPSTTTTLTTSNSSGQLNNPFLSQQQNQKGPTISQLQNQQSTFPFGASSANTTNGTGTLLNGSNLSATQQPVSFGIGQLAQPLIIPPASTNSPLTLMGAQPNIMTLPPFAATTTTNAAAALPPIIPPIGSANFQSFGQIPNPSLIANSTNKSNGNQSTNPFLMM